MYGKSHLSRNQSLRIVFTDPSGGRARKKARVLTNGYRPHQPELECADVGGFSSSSHRRSAVSSVLFEATYGLFRGVARADGRALLDSIVRRAPTISISIPYAGRSPSERAVIFKLFRKNESGLRPDGKKHFKRRAGILWSSALGTGDSHLPFPLVCHSPVSSCSCSHRHNDMKDKLFNTDDGCMGPMAFRHSLLFRPFWTFSLLSPSKNCQNRAMPRVSHSPESPWQASCPLV